MCSLYDRAELSLALSLTPLWSDFTSIDMCSLYNRAELSVAISLIPLWSDFTSPIDMCVHENV